MLASFTTASGLSLGVALGVLLAAVAAAAAAYRPVLASADLGPWVRRGFLALRVGAVVLAALVLVDPVLSVERTPRDAQRVAVLVDSSRSMNVRDSIGGASRIEAAARILGPDKLVERLGAVARVEVSAFDLGSHPFDPLHPTATGEASDLAGAVARALDRKDPAPLAGIVLLTDGCETGARSLGELPLGVPVYPVALGSIEESVADAPDVALVSVQCDRTVLVRSTVEARVRLRATHLDGERVAVQIRKGEQVLSEASATLGPGALEVPLRFTPGDPGLLDLEARVVPHERERFLENNARSFALEVSAQKLRVFYYEGTPRWEYKFLSRELRKDVHLSVDAVLRTSGERAYEQTTAAGAGRGTFPASREALRRFDAVVLGDVRARDLSPEQGKALHDWVSEDGGGLVVLAGKDSLSPDGLVALGLEPLLPVGVAGVRVTTGTLTASPAPEGVSHPALAGIARFLPLESAFATGPLKPGAQLLASAEGPGGTIPLVVTQRFGTGRVYFLATDADWKWVMKHRAQGGEDLFVRVWGQAIRWAANREPDSEKSSRALVSTDKPIYRPGETVKVRVAGAVAPGTPLVVDGLPLPLQKGADGLEAAFVPERAGLQKVTVGEASCEFLVERAAGEFDRIAVHETLLHQVAAASGGRCFDATTAALVPEALRASGRLRIEVHEVALGESSALYALLVAALTLEWALRKRMQVI